MAVKKQKKISSKKAPKITKNTKKVTKKATGNTSARIKKKAVVGSVKKTQGVSKKTSGKKSKKTLVRAMADTAFWIHEGPVVVDMKQLLNAIHTMKKEQYNHHVNAEKNDFASWVEFILCDRNCAEEILKTRTIKETEKILEKHLKNYKT